MTFKLFNTESRELEALTPRTEQEVKMYVCGPTVYSSPHIGHARSYVFFDTLAKYLRFKGFEVKYLQNITDMGKNIRGVAEKNECSQKEVVDRYEREHFQAMKALNIDSVDAYERSSENVNLVINQIERILSKGHAYLVEKGVFFDTAGQKDFGALTHKSREELPSVEDYPGKKAPQDFSLWKYEPNWGITLSSPFGEGRPHWHVLDTAFAEKYFKGGTYDIHGGGMDCIYPHHESVRSILQSISGEKKPVQLWVHNEAVNVGGQKMSKSLGNTKNLEELFKDVNPPILRLSMLARHYRDSIDFNVEMFTEWREKLSLFESLALKLGITNRQDIQNKNYGIFNSYLDNFINAMDNNMDTPAALGTVVSFAEQVSRLYDGGKLKAEDARKAHSLFVDFDHVLGIGLFKGGELYDR